MSGRSSRALKSVHVRFILNVLKAKYGKNVNLVYTDTFLLEFKNVDMYKQMKTGKLAPYIWTW